MKTFQQFLNKTVKTPEELAEIHKVRIDDILKQLDMGIKVEKEHTSKDEIARQISLAHLEEDPRYYSKLADMERK